jgi:hypothetical protein
MKTDKMLYAHSCQGSGEWRPDKREGCGGGGWRPDKREGCGGGEWRPDKREGCGGGGWRQGGCRVMQGDDGEETREGNTRE